MKRTYTLIVMLGLVFGALLTGCNSSTDTKPADTGAGTNPPAAAPASTNK